MDNIPVFVPNYYFYIMDYLDLNKKLWNERTVVHVDSAFYDNETFLKGKNSLNEIELNLLCDVKGKTILHLQCHFGQDSISLARLGAQVTAVDFSEKAIETAIELNKKSGTDCKFICSDVYSLNNVLDQKFDIVFTSYGVIGWLPDMQKWASLISSFLKPEGVFVIAEFHPAVWMFDNDFKYVQYSYFKSEPIIETDEGTYADKDANITTTSVTWNHSLSEVINSLINSRLRIDSFNEFDYSPYNCLNNMVEVSENRFMIKGMEKKLPLVYAIRALKQ